MIEFIKNWINGIKEKEVQNRKERINIEVREDYNVTERNGSLYLIVGNRAVSKIEGTTTVTEVVNMVKKARNAQISFKENESVR